MNMRTRNYTDRDPESKTWTDKLHRKAWEISISVSHNNNYAMRFDHKSKVGRASLLYFSGSSECFCCHKLFQAKITAMTHGPNTIWFSKTCQRKDKKITREIRRCHYP